MIVGLDEFSVKLHSNHDCLKLSVSFIAGTGSVTVISTATVYVFSQSTFSVANITNSGTIYMGGDKSSLIVNNDGNYHAYHYDTSSSNTSTTMLGTMTIGSNSVVFD